MIFATAILKLEKDLILDRECQKARWWQMLTWAVIGAGILLRLFHFFYNRSFFNDESFLANSLIRLSYGELVSGPLEYEQKAPIGYLLLTKLCVVLFGKGEMALRLVSLLCGIASLFLFRTLARHFLRPAGVFVAVAILAIAPPSLLYSVEAKQYCTEMLATLAALYLYVRYGQKTALAAGLRWGLLGAGLIWFSYSVIFILAGMAAAISLWHLLKKDWKPFFRYLIPFSLWLVSFALNYLLFTQRHAGSGWLIDWFDDLRAFMPLPPASPEDLSWFLIKPLHVLHLSLGLSWLDLDWRYSDVFRGVTRMPFLPLFCWVSGSVLVYRQDRRLFWVLVLPFLLALLASGVRMYPLHERLTYFLVPFIIIMLVKGFERLLHSFSSIGLRYALLVLLMAGAVANSAYTLVNPELFGRPAKNMTAREALLYVNDRYRPGDVVYVYWNFRHFYRYYRQAYRLRYDAMQGSDVRFASRDTLEYARNLTPDLEAISGRKRVWVIYSKIQREAIGDPFGQPAWYYKHFKPGRILYGRLTARGQEKESFETQDMKVSLFDLSAY